MSRRLTEYAIHWEPAPPYPDFSAPFYSLEEALEALARSAFTGVVVAREVAYGEWRELHDLVEHQSGDS